jgi:hypothetical protein
MVTRQRGPALRRSGRRPVRAGAAVAAVAAVALSMAGCSHVLPVGPTPPPAPVPRHLATAIVLQVVRSQPPSSAGSCPAGSVHLPPLAVAAPGGGRCYRQLGRPLSVTSAAVTYYQRAASSQQPANYGLLIALPAASRAALLAMTTRAYNARDQMATIVAGKTWGIAVVMAPFAGGQFEIAAQGASQARQLQHALIPSA